MTKSIYIVLSWKPFKVSILIIFCVENRLTVLYKYEEENHIKHFPSTLSYSNMNFYFIYSFSGTAHIDQHHCTAATGSFSTAVPGQMLN